MILTVKEHRPSKILNPSIAMVFFKTYLQLGVYDPPGISQVLCHLEIKFQRFLRVSFSTVPIPTFAGDSFTPKFKMAPKNR